MPTKILVLSGPNLQRLGKREPHIYGSQTLEEIHALVAQTAEQLGVAVDCRQSNYEGALIDWIGSARDSGFSGIVINPGAYTHTSIALYDALLAALVPAVEVHLSNPEARETFRHRSVTAGACVGKVAGFGAGSYLLGLRGLVERLETAAMARSGSGAKSTAAGGQALSEGPDASGAARESLSASPDSAAAPSRQGGSATSAGVPSTAAAGGG